MLSPAPSSRSEREEDEQQQQQDDGLRGSDQAIRPLIRRNVNKHSRQESVEQTLFDLTVAMSALHKRGGKGGKGQTSSHHANTTAEEFAQNAVRLSDQQNNNNNEHSGSDAAANGSVSGSGAPASGGGSGRPPGSSRWGLIRENLPALREENRNESGESLNEHGQNGFEEDEGPKSDVETGDTSGSSRYSQNNDDGVYNNSGSKNNNNNRYGGGRKSLLAETNDKFKDDWQKWSEFFRPHRGRLYAYGKNVTLYLLVPLISIAAILFYFAGNVPTGKNGDGGGAAEQGASASYILFFCARQIITLSMALAMQCVIIDIIALQTRFFLRTVGPVITLLIVQSKGWPHIVFWWTIFNYAMNFGDGGFAHHWLFYQDLIDLFNSTNPSEDHEQRVVRSLLGDRSIRQHCGCHQTVLGRLASRS